MGLLLGVFYMSSSIYLTPRFEAALVYACRLHAAQLRADGKTPYVAHLMGVAALVLEGGGNEDETIAALLHDAIEDQGGDRTRQEIRQQFGDSVAQIVEGCTETVHQSLSWHDRKAEFLDRLRHAPLSVQRVVLADKLHNLRALLVSLQEEGDRVWERFNGGQTETLCFYRSVGRIIWEAEEHYRVQSWLHLYEQVLEEVERLSHSGLS